MKKEVTEAICTICDEIVKVKDYYDHTEKHYLEGKIT